MRLQNYIINENKAEFISAVKKLSSFTWDKAEKIIKDNMKIFFKTFEDKEDEVLKIINRNFKTNFKSFDQILKKEIKESLEIDEDLKHWWYFVKDQVFPVVSFIPALDAWVEIDKMVRAGSIEGGDMKVAIIYTLVWLLMLSGKYVADWYKWKKENPEQYSKEREVGKGGLI